MPARSKSQQRLFGMLHAYNKGEFSGSKALKKKLSEMSKHISDEDVKHFAETKHKDLPEKKAARLYTYLPKDNTADTDGLLSTLLAPSGWEKYRGRTKKYKKEDVLEALDSWDPSYTRSKCLSAFAEPIPKDAHKDHVAFARAKHLYSFDTHELLKAKILKQLRETNKGRGTHAVKEEDIGKNKADFSRVGKPYQFSHIPHYLVETRDGKIPPEFVRDEEKRIDFPADEIPTLKKQKRIFTTRVSDDFDRYKEGDVVTTPWGEKYKVSSRSVIPNLKKHPFYDKLTEAQRKVIGAHDKISGLWLDKVASDKEMKHDPDFIDLLARYKMQLGKDLSHMKLYATQQPRNSHGKKVDFPVEQFGGCWTDKGKVYVNSDFKPVAKHYGVKEQGLRKSILAHELAHEIWNKLSDKRFKEKYLATARKEKFNTPYLKTVNRTSKSEDGTLKIDQETFCEYISHLIRNKNVFKTNKDADRERASKTDRGITKTRPSSH